MNFENILSVSHYERKTLFRSWFFRIFSILALLFIFGINTGMFGNHGGARWTTRAIAANLPYLNILFINLAQAIIAVFLASDFLSRDKKLDTTEVIYTRPISNGEYVLGKTFGILGLFLGLVLLVLIMSLTFNLIKQDVPVVWQAYIYYPLLINIPTLIFILGLSFLLMIVIKNQAVTFILLLGYIGFTLFYFQDKLYGLLDYMSFNLPMVYSDIIQFSDQKMIIYHRMAYLFLGVGFIFATIRFLSRLPQTGRKNVLNLIASIIFILLGIGFAYQYYTVYQQEDLNRGNYVAINNQYAKMPAVDIISNQLKLEKKGRKLIISSAIYVKNSNESALDTLLFSLNPGFKIDSIIPQKGRIEYLRNKQLLLIIPEEGLKPNRRSKYTLYYSGIPDESIAFLDVPKDALRELKRIEATTLNKKPGINTNEFLLLTPELLWYPIAGVGFNHTTFLNRELDFVKYDLTVYNKRHLTAISSGKTLVTDSITHFTPETDLSSLALVIGKFKKLSIEIDDIEYNVFFHPKHDFFSQYFTNINDTIGALIKEAKDEYEIEEIDLYYPFKRINLIEVPVQFHAYERAQVQTTELIQPEIIFFPEKGAGIYTLDFSQQKYRADKRNRKEDNSKTEREIEVDIFKNFLETTFFREALTRGGRGRDNNSIINFYGTNYSKNPYCAFPLYYSYVTGISSKNYPFFNAMLEEYLKEGYEVSFREAMEGGMTDSERANIALRDNSMIEIFSKSEKTLTQSVLSQTGSFLILALKNKVGLTAFDNFLYYYLEDHAFQVIPFEQFSADFYKEFEVDIEPYFKTINTKGEIPIFLMSSVDYYQTRDDVGEVYLVKFKIANTGKVKGIIDVSFRIRGQGGGSSAEQRLYELDPGVTKEIGITLFDQPRAMSVNTLISGNIPSSYTVFLRSAEESRISEIEEYENLSEETLSTKIKGEYIVDNEDSGFSYSSVSNESKIKQYIDSRKVETEEIQYRKVSRRRSPAVWTPTAHTGFYGDVIRSGLMTRNGDGQNIVKWTMLLPEAGFYDVYTYIPISAMIGRPSRKNREERNQGGDGGGRGGPSFADEGYVYKYLLSSNEGEEEIEFVLTNIVDGWNKLGRFHFPADSASIILTNDIEGRRVVADAVKWVRK